MKPQDQKDVNKPSAQAERPPWQFFFVLIVIAIGLFAVVGKTVGLF